MQTVHVFVRICFRFSWVTTWERLLEGRLITNCVFNLFRNRGTLFQSSFIILRPQQPCLGLQGLHILSTLVLLFSSIRAVPVDGKCYLVVLICICLTANDVDRTPFYVPVGSHYTFLGQMSLQILCQFFNWAICLFIVDLS